jgi:phosphotriesterase-related protein
MRDLIIVLWASIFVGGCTSSLKEGELVTVRGMIPVKEMGVSLIHEHVLVDFIGADSTGYHRWNRSAVVARALPYLIQAKEKGVKTFFDCTPAYLGRDPLLLRELSEKTGIQIVTNTGYYGARNNLFIPPSAFDATAY